MKFSTGILGRTCSISIIVFSRYHFISPYPQLHSRMSDCVAVHMQYY